MLAPQGSAGTNKKNCSHWNFPSDKLKYKIFTQHLLLTWPKIRFASISALVSVPFKCLIAWAWFEWVNNTTALEIVGLCVVRIITK